MPELESERDALETLAAEFVKRQRCGERPSVSDYAARFPDLAEDILDLFPTIAAMERLKVQKQNAQSMRAALGGVRPDHLGEFRIIREIGRGGMGIVYEAEQESLGRRVALKVLPKHSLLAPEQLKRFQREARIAANLRHANIVSVFGVGEHDGLHYYVMQFISGVGLDEIIRQLASAEQSRNASPLIETGKVRDIADRATPALDNNHAAPAPCASGEPQPIESARQFCTHVSCWKSIARIGLQVAKALHYAHTQGTLHCDIKPANLLIDSEGVVWVTDFGVAKAMQFEAVTRTGDLTGTLQYIAPERFQGQTDARSDVFSLGLTLYELLTLRPAHGGRQRSPHGVADTTPVPPRKLNRQMPRDLETIVLKAIASDPNRRYLSAGAMADDLQLLLDGHPVRARRARRIERLGRWCYRNPLLAGLSSAVAVLITLVAILLATVGPRSSPPSVSGGDSPAGLDPADGVPEHVAQGAASSDLPRGGGPGMMGRMGQGPGMMGRMGQGPGMMGRMGQGPAAADDSNIDQNDPEAVLAHKDALGLSEEQVQRLERMVDTGAKEAANVLTEDQKQKLQGLAGASSGMRGMRSSMMPRMRGKPLKPPSPSTDNTPR